jgi:tRNA A-37 threonylcarbamoyl transferase component Bud32
LSDPHKVNVIVKMVDVSREEGLEMMPTILNEVRAYEELGSLEVLPQYYGSGLWKNNYVLIIKEVSGKMLHHLSKPEKEMVRRPVLAAYDALHKAGRIQGDVQGSNVLVDAGKVTILDLGFSERVPPESNKVCAEKELVLDLLNQ